MKKITLKDLHEINNKYPEMRDIHLSHQFNQKTQNWEFVGYRCSKCGRTFKRQGFIERHEESCKPPQKLAVKDEVPIQIRTITGEIKSL